MPQAGWVYILTNPAMPGLVKIGHTTRQPEQRAAELTSATGVPSPFALAWAHAVTDHAALERIVHDHLAGCRARHNREFFRCTVAHARQVIEREAAALLLPWWRAWLHQLRHPRSVRRPKGRRRRFHPDVSGRLIVPMALVITYVVTFKPGWLPPALIHLMARLPHLVGPPLQQF